LRKVSIAFLWHMHQPPYLNPFLGEYRLPWVFLHGLKDYYDMPALLEQCPGTRVTINLVPSLFSQLRDYEHGGTTDRYLRVAATPADQLTDLEHRFVTRFFFPFPDEIIRNFSPHYLQLKKKLRAAEAPGNGHRLPTPQDYRDAQVLFLLSWCGETLKREEPVRGLLAKGRDFTPADQVELLEALAAFTGRILPEYARLSATGRLEVAVSPYSHPILPLLVDVNNARVAKPSSPLPSEPFAYPIDARLHLALAQERYAELFGHKARGMWPSEGSVSPEVARLIREAGLDWVCTDRAILEKSLGRAATPDEVLRPWRFEGLTFFFRDTRVSDLIGFTYANWQPAEAVADFLRRVREAAAASTLEHPLVTVAMDGENAWEHFIHGGYEFLRQLYRAIEAAPDLETVTFSDWLEARPETVGTLPHLGTGSWIYGDFATWIGDPVKNRAWEYLSFARKEVAHFLSEYTDMSLDTLKHLPIVEHTLRAESSDWFWWYGEGHTSINDPDFDDLFRANVRFLYVLMGQTPPAHLDKPLAPVERDATSTRPPVAYVRPQISGELDDYFEWLSAGSYELQAGALARVNPALRRVHFGFDEQSFYLRVDLAGVAADVLENRVLEVRFLAPAAAGVRVVRSNEGWQVEPVDLPPQHPCGRCKVAVGHVLELALPLDHLFPGYGPAEGLRALVSFNLRLFKRGMEVERFPWSHDIDVYVNTRDFETENWFV
jgi:alpha-amylase/alpha-mannosidase (GH57 family)